MNLLFINDGSFYAGLVTELLCFNGYIVFEATDAEGVWAALRQKRVDVILCYVPHVVSESLALLAEVRGYDLALPLIAITPYSRSSHGRQQIHALTAHCLKLPFTVEALLQMIGDATGIRQRNITYRVCQVS